jgi:predicted chitinase
MLTQVQLSKIMRSAPASRLDQYLEPLNQAMQAYEINNTKRAAAFIAQLAHESGEFRYMEELWGPTPAQMRYEPDSDLSRRLGNTEHGDGRRFKGRGPIQITGRHNYRKYGELLGKDLEAAPDMAATPDIGFRIAALFWSKNGLNHLADTEDFHNITRRINGGQNGAAKREAYYRLALSVLRDAFRNDPPRAGGTMDGEAGEELPRGPGGPLDGAGGIQITLDARPDTMDFRDLMYVPTLIEVPTHIPLEDYLRYEVPVLDQKSEGACTGFGLATVANYLQLRRRVVPDATPVSARMLYDLARRYDEWPGEDYVGSSARGAIKGWHKHGICAEKSYASQPPFNSEEVLTDARTSEARQRPLGAYFRVNHKDLVSLHSALAEVGVLYATCAVHEGWQSVTDDGAIPYSENMIGFHAFAIVAYDDQGLWLQNSWGPGWGHGGFGRISYDDWLQNGTDTWVARLGAPVILRTLQSSATAHATTSGESAAYAFADLRPHIISVGNQGALTAGGDYGVTADGVRHIFEQDIPRVTRDWDKLRILLYAPGGLTDERSAVQRLAEYRPALLKNQIYPLTFNWHSDYWSTITSLLKDAFQRRRPEGALDATKDFMLDRFDDALEPVARTLTGASAWKEMKENALGASKPGGGARMVVDCLEKMDRDRLEIHMVGHSAGSVLHAPLVELLGERGLPIESCTLWAPACTMDLFHQFYLPAIQSEAIRQFSLFVLSDQAEQDDDCAKVYRKSLLYLVSNALEGKGRIPGFREGEPLLGMEKFIDSSLRSLLGSGRHRLVVTPNHRQPDSGFASQASHHGDFDNDLHTVSSTFANILGAASALKEEGAKLHFRRSQSTLTQRRADIDRR